MKILVFGANGMLGQYVSSYLQNNHHVIRITRKEYDVLTNSIYDLKLIIERNHPDYIINCLGLIPHSQKNNISVSNYNYYKINSLFPNQLAFLAEQYHSALIHITTDCVFNGKKGNYNEDDIHDETSNYGVSKSLGEPNNCCVIRTSIIGEEIRNKRSLLEWVKSNEGGEINGYENHYWNGITCLELAKVIDEMIESNIWWEGVRHIYSPHSVSKYELIKMINDVYKLGIKINKIECDQKVDKTIGSKYEKMFDVLYLEDQIKELKEYKLI